MTALVRLGRLPAGLVMAASLALPAHAAPLDKAACEALEQEASKLTAAGVATDFEKGPAAAAAGLGPDRIASVRRFIEVTELLNFRCMQARIPVKLKPLADEDGDEDEAAIVPPLPLRPKQRPRVSAAPAAPATPPAATARVVPSLPKAKPKARPKINDAYSPPPPPARAGEAPGN